MTTKEKKINEIKGLIKSNPNLSGNKIYNKIKSTNLGIRKQTFQEIFRETKNLAEPSIQKRDDSIPKKFKTAKTRIQVREKAKIRAKVRVKPKPKIIGKIPFEKTKFGKITKDLQKTHGISEKKAIIHARKILKIDKSDYHKINKKDVQILLTHTP